MSVPELVGLGAKASLILTVFGLGLHATTGDAVSLFRRPARLARSIGTMFIAMPIVAALLVLAFDLPPAIRIALGALAISPVPPIWPRKTLHAGGSESYTIGLLTATSVLAIISIPLSLQLLARALGTPLRESPATIAGIALASVLLPLAAGILVRRLAPRPAERASRFVVMAGLTMLVVAVSPIAIELWPAFAELTGNGTLAVMSLFVLTGLALGHLFAGPPTEDRVVLALASCARHPGIAVAIATTNFPEQRLAPAAIVLYLLVSVVVSVPYVAWARKRHERSTAGAPTAPRARPRAWRSPTHRARSR